MKRRKANVAHLTDALVIAHNGKRGPFLWDDGKGSVPGLAVRITPAGGKQYTLRYRLHHRQRSLSLGPVEKYETVEAARDEARAKLKVLAKGIDPHHGGDGTMSAVWDRYMTGLRTGSERRKSKGRPAAAKTIEGLESMWRTHLAQSIGPLAPKDITPGLVRDLHARLSTQRTVAVEGRGGSKRRGGLYIANRVVGALKAAWRVSAVDGLTSGLPDPFIITRNEERPRTMYLKRDEAEAFKDALAAEPLHLQVYWTLMFHTGPRGVELRDLRWEDVGARSIIFRDTKNGTDREVPLPRAAARALAALPRQGRGPFPFTYPKASWARIRKRTGYAKLRPHDVRRSVGTWLGAAGYTSGEVGSLLGHRSDITSKVYIQLGADVEVKQRAVTTMARLIERPTRGRRKATTRRAA